MKHFLPQIIVAVLAPNGSGLSPPMNEALFGTSELVATSCLPGFRREHCARNLLISRMNTVAFCKRFLKPYNTKRLGVTSSRQSTHIGELACHTGGVCCGFQRTCRGRRFVFSVEFSFHAEQSVREHRVLALLQITSVPLDIRACFSQHKTLLRRRCSCP